MRKLTIVSATIATTMILAACQPAAKEEAAAPEVEATATPVEAAPEPAADAAAKAPEAAAVEPAAEGQEHTGSIKVTPKQ